MVAPPVDILEIAAGRLADARAALHNSMMAPARPRRQIDIELARIDLFFCQQDMANVAKVMEGLRD